MGTDNSNSPRDSPSRRYYNVLGIVDSSCVLAERYEYTPYGQRTVYLDAGSNDVGNYARTLASRRMVSIDWGDQPFGLCDIGHQGLMHDEETALVYNRARQLHPGLGRFVQRDPAGYIDGPNLYELVRSSPTVYLDPSGEGIYCTCPAAIPVPAVWTCRIPGAVMYLSSAPVACAARWTCPIPAACGLFTCKIDSQFTCSKTGLWIRDWNISGCP